MIKNGQVKEFQSRMSCEAHLRIKFHQFDPSRIFAPLNNFWIKCSDFMAKYPGWG